MRCVFCKYFVSIICSFKESKLILVKCPRHMAWEAAAFCYPAWKLSDIISQPFQWWPRHRELWLRLCRAPCHGPHRSTCVTVYSLSCLTSRELKEWRSSGASTQKAGKCLGSKMSSRPEQYMQGQFPVFTAAHFSCVSWLCGIIVSIGLRYLVHESSFLGYTAGCRTCSRVDQLTSSCPHLRWKWRARQGICMVGSALASIVQSSSVFFFIIVYFHCY